MIFAGLIALFVRKLLGVRLFSRRFTAALFRAESCYQAWLNSIFPKSGQPSAEMSWGELGSSINHLSKQLGESMDRLQEQNRQLQEDVEKERRLDRMRKDFCFCSIP